MKPEIKINRIVPNIYSDNLEKTKKFYTDFLGMKVAMDLGWIVTFASKTNPTAQINFFKNDKNEKPENEAMFLSIEVSDIDKIYKVAKKSEYSIVYDIKNEPWGVRRFFVKDPNGATLNLLAHIKDKESFPSNP